MKNNATTTTVTILVWPDNCWMLHEEFDDWMLMSGYSDDYYKLEVPSHASEDDIYSIICAHNDGLELTCFECTDNKTCEYRYDPYNTDGDCLASK